MRAVGVRINGYLPRGWVDAGCQFLAFFVVYNGYQIVRGLTDSGDEAAFANAQQVISLERSLGSFFEPGFQQALIDNASWLVDIANYMYLNTHFVITTGFLVWLYLFRNEHFYFVRNMFMVAMGLALIGYALFPTAPPRLFPGDGFTDTIASFTGVAQDSGTASLLVNKYAAVPSMHIAFSLMIAVPAASLSRRSLSRTLWTAYPLCVFFVIVATGNHFWFDAAAGAAVACLAALAARALARLRPGLWAWPEPRREATAGAGPATPGSVPCAPGHTSIRTRSSSVPPIAEGREQPRTPAQWRGYARDRLIESRLTPNAISITGLILNLAAAALILERLFFLAGIAFIVGSIMDTLDGRYSRMSGKGTMFGAFLDSTLDRIEEGVVLTAVAWYFADRGDSIAAAACVLTVLGSLMVSYTRARAEAIGVECKVGIATRPVRVVILSIGLVFAKGAGLGDFELLAPAIYAMAALTAFTVGQRVWHVRGELKALEGAEV